MLVTYYHYTIIIAITFHPSDTAATTNSTHPSDTAAIINSTHPSDTAATTSRHPSDTAATTNHRHPSLEYRSAFEYTGKKREFVKVLP